MHLWCRWRSILFTSVMLFVRQIQSFCPAKCTCAGDANLRASCISASLDEVPIQLNPESKYINLTLNKIRNVDFALAFYTQLEVLDLSQNLIETLGSKNFEYQNELRTLNLSWNSISHLGKDTFKGLKNLLLLDLSHNRLETIHPNAMLDLSGLIELDLTSNFILSMESGILKNMISLEILLFRNNQLLDVPAKNLENLRSLKSLDLAENLIKFIGNDSFVGLKELEILCLSGNIIIELNLGAFDGLVGLKQLDLADNNLTIVPTQQLSKLSNLTILSLSGNKFKQLPAVALLNLFHLRELHLERLERLTRIDSRAFVDNTHLQSINLNNNPQFSELPQRLFHGNPNLLEISMQSNNLKTIDAAQFPIDRIQVLQLGDNPLHCNCSLLWLWRLVTGNYEESTLTPTTLASSGETGDEKPFNELEPNPNENITNFLRLDSDLIGCDTWRDQTKIRQLLRTMDESEVTCPAHIITVVCAILSVLVVVMTGASILFYLRFIKRRRKLLHDRHNLKTVVDVSDRIIQHNHMPHSYLDHHQHHHGGGIGGGGGVISAGDEHHHGTHRTPADKLELERYLAAQAIANEYRALKPWELPIKEALDESDHHYEKFDHYDYPDTRQMSKPHVVYV